MKREFSTVMYTFFFISNAEIELKMLLKCCLIHIIIIMPRYILYLEYLCLCLGLVRFMSYLYGLFFSLIFIVINHINLIKTDALVFCTFFRISPNIFG